MSDPAFIYLDNHSTTRVDRRVIDAMLPVFESDYGNAGSSGHRLGVNAQDLVEQSTVAIAAAIGASSDEIIFTSGATESNNLAIHGVSQRRRKPGHIITTVAEHKATLDPIAKLEKSGFSVTRLPIGSQDAERPGEIDLEQFESSITEDTFLVSVMLGNNEIGTLQPLQAISKICQQREILLHTDATQSVGKIPIDVVGLGVDLMSFSAHKIYGPKGIGALFIRQRGPRRRVRLVSQIDGGQQQRAIRSGTLNVPGIVGFAKAIELCATELEDAGPLKIQKMRDTLYRELCAGLGDLPINGPRIGGGRLHGNLNCQFPGLNAESIMALAPGVGVSTGSACSASSPEPSHVLKALNLTDDQVHSSLRFGIGRFNTNDEMIESAKQIVTAAQKLRTLG